MEKQSKKDLNIMYKRILVPTDGTPMSEKAVEGAARFAKSLGSSPSSSRTPTRIFPNTVRNRSSSTTSA